MPLFGVPWILSPVFMLQNHISEGVCIFERAWLPAASTGFSVGFNMGRLMFWIQLKKTGGKEAKVWLWRNVFCAKISIYYPRLKNKKNPNKIPQLCWSEDCGYWYIKKNKASHAAKAVQTQLTRKMPLESHTNNHNYTLISWQIPVFWTSIGFSAHV